MSVVCNWCKPSLESLTEYNVVHWTCARMLIIQLRERVAELESENKDIKRELLEVKQLRARVAALEAAGEYVLRQFGDEYPGRLSLLAALLDT